MNRMNLNLQLSHPRRGGHAGRARSVDAQPGRNRGLDGQPGHGHHGGPRRGRGDLGKGPGAGFGPGYGPGFGPGFGPGEGRGPRGGGRGPRRGRRGDVRRAILALLAEEPMNGYGIITAIAERSDGSWRPGPGSVYPALRSLDEEGLIAPDESDEDPRRKVFALTEDGTAYAETHGEELAQAFADATTPRRGFREMRREIGQLVVAVEQVVVAGQPAQLEAAQRVLADARRSLYRILAEDETASAGETASADAGTDGPGAHSTDGSVE
jgi:DNA-binding PadR family transcriptional regulator